MFNAKSSVQPDVLSAPFSHMTLTQTPTNDGRASTSDSRHYPAVYHHPPSVVLQGANGYMVAGPSGAPPPGPGFPGSAPCPTPVLSQSLLQQPFIQQPVQQVETAAVGERGAVISPAVTLPLLFLTDVLLLCCPPPSLLRPAAALPGLLLPSEPEPAPAAR